MSKGSATLRCFALALRSRTTALASRSPVSKAPATFGWVRLAQVGALALLSLTFLGAGGNNSLEARFNDLGHHKLICACSCNQILLECNHLGCTYSEKMRNELSAALVRGNNDDLTLQGFVQEYGPTVLAAPTTSGFNRVAWIMPYAVLLAGFAFAGMIVMSWKNKPLLQPEARKETAEWKQFREQARRETDL